MQTPLTIVDYQMGNLRSVQKAIEKVGGAAVISGDPDQIANADRLVLPGVGGFADAMKELRSRNLIDPIRQFCNSGKPFLGICLGLQLLFDRSSENGDHEGLGILPGRVIRFADRPGRKVPHMGWNTVTKRGLCPVLDQITDDDHFYFVHSYYVRPEDPSIDALRCDYGETFTAAIWRNNVFATQFHPEKSQAVGMKLLSGFLQYEPSLAGDRP